MDKPKTLWRVFSDAASKRSISTATHRPSWVCTNCMRQQIKPSNIFRQQRRKQSSQPGDDPLFRSIVDNPPQLIRAGKKHNKIGLFILAAIPITAFALGCWQVQRLGWKSELIARFEDRLIKDPLPLPPQVDPDAIKDFDYRRVLARGVLRHDQEMLIGPRMHDGVDGYQVVTPLDRSAEFEGFPGNTTVLINRGWIPKDKADHKLRPDGLPKGTVVVEGLLREPWKKNMFTPENKPEEGKFYFPDVYEMAAHTNSQPVWVEETMRPDLLESYAREDKGVPIGRPPEVNLRNNHGQYIFTWFSLSAATTVMMWMLLKRPASGTSRRVRQNKSCALHNAIVKHGWVASGHDIADLKGRYEWPPSDELFLHKAQERLHPDVIEMLKRCIDPGLEGGTFFRFLQGMPKDEAWWEWTEGHDEDWIQLYMASLDTSETGIAVVYDQSDHSVKYVGSCHDGNPVKSPAEWQRLETMLSAWVDLIECGKVVALDATVKREIYGRIVGDDLRTEDSAPFDQQTPGAMELISHSDPWETSMWTKQDLQDTLQAWHTLIETIHERMPNIKSSPFVSKGLFSAETLLAAGIRKNSFAWHFLRNAYRPAFDYLGPSLKLATANDLIDSVWKSARENFTPTPWHPSFKPVHEPGPFPVPLLLGTSSAKNWHSRHPNSAFAAIETVPWGLYFDDTGYDALLTEDTGRLVLPYDLGGEGFAVRADGSKLGHKYVQGWAELYQLGQHPLVPCHGAQMFRVLEVWRECVRAGVWRVVEEGVDESAEKFRDADTEEWNEVYTISFYDMRSRN